MSEAQKNNSKRTLTSGLKEIGVIEKRMRANIELIMKYSSIVSTFKPHFKDEDAQREKVKSLVQANVDLFKEAINLKLRLEKTNQTTEVVLDGKSYTISELLFIKHTSQNIVNGIDSFQGNKVKGVGNLLYKTFKAMNDDAAETKLNQLKGRSGDDATIIRFYDEEQKLTKIRELEDLINKITTELESINATTPLVEL